MQFGQSTADGASRHSSGEHPQSAQRTTSFVFDFIDGAGSRAVLYNSERPSTVAMYFIVLTKFRHKPTKQELDKSTAYFARLAKEGTKVHQFFWTLGRYDAVVILEGKDEKTALQNLLNFPFEIATETLVAIPREEALKMVK